jgi:hypothetical protein
VNHSVHLSVDFRLNPFYLRYKLLHRSGQVVDGVGQRRHLFTLIIGDRHHGPGDFGHVSSDALDGHGQTVGGTCRRNHWGGVKCAAFPSCDWGWGTDWPVAEEEMA